MQLCAGHAAALRYYRDNPMAKPPAIRSLTIQNLLSFGPEPTTVELQNLNVLIGANGSGKSNLIEVLGLLHAAPDDFARAMTKGGPVDEWLWKGSDSRTPPIASVQAITSPASGKRSNLTYHLVFTRGADYRLEITDERIHAAIGGSVFWIENGRPKFKERAGGMLHTLSNASQVSRLPKKLNPQASVLSTLKDRWNFPEITHLGSLFESLRLYRNWEFGTLAGIRVPCDANLPNESLDEDFSNLGVVLDRLLAIPPVYDQIVDSIRTFFENAKEIRTNIEGGRVQTRLFEKHLSAGIPLTRMSDGTLRWLTLLAILLNPDPPPLVCIEEPELGLHPDMIGELAKLLIDASTRMQLIVTTHSESLVGSLSDMPEAVLVCEKENGASKFERLDPNKLELWLEEYTLGQLWTKGQLGGTRW